MMVIESRVVISLLLLAGALMFAVAAMVEEPHEVSKASTDAASGMTLQETDEHAADPAGAHAPIVAEAAGTSEHDGAEEHGAGAHESDTFFGISLGAINLAAPRLALILIALTIPVALAVAVRWSTWSLLTATVLGLVASAAAVFEATRAGEELGIVVPFPILIAVLYGGAAGLAALAVLESRANPVAGHAEVHASVSMR